MQSSFQMYDFRHLVETGCKEMFRIARVPVNSMSSLFVVFSYVVVGVSVFCSAFVFEKSGF